MAISRCSGLLLGVPDPDAKMKQKGLVTIGSWVQQDHVLVKEVEKWKLSALTGRSAKDCGSISRCILFLMRPNQYAYEYTS